MSSKNRRNSSGKPGTSMRGRRRGVSCLVFAVNLGIDRTSTTAGRTFLTMSRYDVISLGTAGGDDNWPWRPVLEIRPTIKPPRTTQTRAIGQRDMLSNLPLKNGPAHGVEDAEQVQTL